MEKDLVCPYCGSRDVVYYSTTEYDAEGKHEHHRVRCENCDRTTYDMDSYYKALEAFWYG